MRLTRIRFFLLIAMIMALSGAGAQVFQRYATPGTSADTAYLVVLAVTSMIFVRSQFWEGVLASVYAGSLLFIFFYFFVAPTEAPLVLFLFFWPTYLWQKRQIGDRVLATAGLFASGICWFAIGRPAVPVLLFPILHLFAKRLAGRVQTRYTRFTTDLGRAFSLSQRQRGAPGSAASESGWLGFLQEEFESLPRRFEEVWEASIRGGKTAEAQEWAGPLPTLFHIQNARELSQSLTALTARDQGFRMDAFLKRAESVFWKVQEAWYNQNLEPIHPLVSDALFEQFRAQISEQKAAGIRFRFQGMTIFENRPAQVHSDRNFDVIHLFLRAASADSLIDLVTGEVLAEEEHRRQFTEYWTFIRRPSAQTLAKPGLLEGSCPNCSAPLEIGQATVCRSCGSFIRSGAFDWVLAKVTQACEWEYRQPEGIPGWKQVLAADPGFTLQQIEDRGGVMFWQFRQAERARQNEPLARFATPECCARFSQRLATGGTWGWDFMENIALGAVRLRGIQCGSFRDRLYLQVAWSGIPVTRDSHGREVRGVQIPTLARDVFVLVRRHGQVTDGRTTLTSAHCPGCGAPLTSAFNVTCGYCNLLLNEGTAGWLLERICSEEDPAFSAVLESADEPGDKVPATALARRLDRQVDVLYAMIQVMLADGRVDDAEQALLKQMARQALVSDERLAAMILETKAGRVQIPEITSGREALQVLEQATLMAFADGVLDPAEEQTLGILATYLGFGQADVQRMIGKVRVDRHQRASSTVVASAVSEPSSQSGGTPERLTIEGVSLAVTDVLTVMIQILAADGKVEDRERELLRMMATRAGISSERLNIIFRDVQRGTLCLQVPATTREAWALLCCAIRMASVDGRISPEEETVLGTIANRFGYSPIDVKRALNQFEAG